MAQSPEESARIPALPPLELSEREIALRDLFCSEYLVDYDQVAAAMRCGFPRHFAIEWAAKFMDEPYVQNKIKTLTFTACEPQDEATYNIQRIKQQLFREAHYHGPGSSHAARVAALRGLVKVYGIESPTKSEIEHTHRGGVMRIPAAPSNPDDWESIALESQRKLQGG